MLLQLTRSADDVQRRVDLVRALTDLVRLMHQHVRRFLPDFLALVHEFWAGSPLLLPHVLALLAELSREWGAGGGAGAGAGAGAACGRGRSAGRRGLGPGG